MVAVLVVCGSKSVLYVHLARDKETKKDTTKNPQKCMILFRPGSILTNPASMMNEYKDSLKDFLSSLGADVSDKLNVHNNMAYTQKHQTKDH